MARIPTMTVSAEVVQNFVPFVRVFKDGRVERLSKSPYIPPSDHPNSTNTNVLSKDIILSPETNVGARLFLPKTIDPGERLPLLVYYHGGGFMAESAFCSRYSNYVSSVVDAANVIAVSVEYRLAPEHPVPACYDDSWEVTKWVGSHANKQGPEPWLSNHGDFERVFFAGDSAGANIAHNMAAKASVNDGPESGVIKPLGMILANPFFGNSDVHKFDKMWGYICSDFNGWEDPKMNPMAHPSIMAGLVCKKILTVTAGRDSMKNRAVLYYEALKKSGWSGEVEMLDFEKEGHVFHLRKPTSENAGILMKRVVSFF